MECGRLQSLSLGVINSTVDSERWKVTERGLFTSGNQSKPVQVLVTWLPQRLETHNRTPIVLEVRGGVVIFVIFKRKLAPPES